MRLSGAAARTGYLREKEGNEYYNKELRYVVKKQLYHARGYNKIYIEITAV